MDYHLFMNVLKRQSFGQKFLISSFVFQRWTKVAWFWNGTRV